MVANKGTVYYDLLPYDDWGRPCSNPHFAVVVSRNAANARLQTRLLAWMTSAKPPALDPFLSHLCFTDPTKGQPARRISAFEFWNIEEVPLVTLARASELGSCCDQGLDHFGDLWHHVVLGETIQTYIHDYIAKNTLLGRDSKRSSSLDAGDVVEIQYPRHTIIELVLSCKQFHRHLCAGTSRNPIDSVISLRLVELTQEEATRSPAHIIWTRIHDEAEKHYTIFSGPRRTRLRSALNVRCIGTITENKLDAVHVVVGDILGV